MVERDVFFYETTPSHIVCTLSFLFPFFLFLSLPLSFFSCEKGQVEGKERRRRRRKSQRIFFCFAGRERFLLPPHWGRPRFSRNPAVDLKGWVHVLMLQKPNASTSPASQKEGEMGEEEEEEIDRGGFAPFSFFLSSPSPFHSFLFSRQRKGSDTQTAMLQGIYPAAQYAFKDSMIH